MNSLCERFAPLMAETLHYAGAPEGLERPLSEAAERLVELAEREARAAVVLIWRILHASPRP